MLKHASLTASQDDFSEYSIQTPVEQFCQVLKKWLIDGAGISGVYLPDVIPFRFVIDKELSHHGFLFTNNKKPWSTDHLTKVLTQETSKQMEFRMTVQEYRHIVIAIDREFIQCEWVDFDENDEDDHDICDLIAVHSSKMVNNRYAHMGGLSQGLTPESIKVFQINLFHLVSNK